MNKRNRILTVSTAFASIAILVISMAFTMQEPWEVPAKYKNMKNPIAADDASANAGAMLYKKHCASCHGKVGLGDGVKARQLETFPGDFSGEAYQGQTDGDHFYKTKFGRNEMPAYEKKVSDDDIWNMVNYMRTFKK
jgi:mono/diheme cytochrome c family protein